MLNKPSLKQFEYFLAVAEHRSFTHAAKRLHVTKTAVSNTIRELEKELGVDLFIRTTRKVSLTEEGRLLKNQCLRLQQELESARMMVSGFHQNPQGTLRVHCNPFWAESHLMPLIKKYQQKFDQVKIEILLDERMPDMQKEMVDIVLGVNWPAPDDIVARPLAKTRYVLCASPKYLAKYGEPKQLQELQHHNLLAHLGRNQPNQLLQLYQEESFYMNSHLGANHGGFLKHCAISGMGIVQLHDYMVEKELSSGELVEILSAQFKQTIPLYVYYQKQHYVQPKIRQFINLLSMT